MTEPCSFKTTLRVSTLLQNTAMFAYDSGARRYNSGLVIRRWSLVLHTNRSRSLEVLPPGAHDYNSTISDTGLRL